MQTFLPYPDFRESAFCLDRLRLGKQRVEAVQILRTLRGDSDGWKNHPAVRMWRGYESALAMYADAMITEWMRRGYRNTLVVQRPHVAVQPMWLGDAEFHDSHKSNLLRKDPTHYGRFGWEVEPNMAYVWPKGL